VPRSSSRLSTVITLVVMIGALVVVVSAVRALVVEVGNDAAWAAVLAGLALAAWGLHFHLLGSSAPEDETDEQDESAGAAPSRRGRTRTERLGAAAVSVLVASGAYWFLRAELDRTVTESVVVTGIVLGLRLLNRYLDAVIRRRQGGAGGTVSEESTAD